MFHRFQGAVRVLSRTFAIILLSVLSFVALGMPPATAVDVPAGVRIERLTGLAPLPPQPPGGNADGRGHVALGQEAGWQLSRPTEAPLPFSLLGFAVPDGVQVEFRTSLDGGTWGPWEHVVVNPDEGPDPTAAEDLAATQLQAAEIGGRAWSEPVWVGEGRWVQTRVQGASPDDVAVELIDSAGLSRGWLGTARDAVAAAFTNRAPAPVDSAHAQALQPTIITRAQWGADESLRRGSPEYSRRLRFGAVHHTASASSYSQAEAPAIVRGIYAYHTRSNGWNDLGYNFLVDRFGNIYEGRAGGVDRNVIGAHAGGFNTSSFGVAFIGTHTSSAPTSAALEAMAKVFAWKFDLGHIDVSGAYTATSMGSTRYPRGTQVTLATMSGHRDLSSTTCPGQAVYNLMPILRHRVLELHGNALLDHAANPEAVTVVRGSSISGPVELSTRLRPAGAWSLAVTDSSGRVVHRDSGSGSLARSVWTPTNAPAGTYTYTFSSSGRRSASDTVELLPPVITGAAASPSAAKVRDGALATPVTFSAKAFPGADWTVTVTAPGGQQVHRVSGSGPDVRSTWSGPAPRTGDYRWTIEATEAKSVSGTVEVFADLWRRAGAAADVTGGAVQLSQEAFPSAGSAAHAVLARADVFADALSGGPLAGTGGPVLLNPSDRLDERVLAELRRVLPAGRTVYVLGGQEAIQASVTAALEGTWDVRRLSGRERTETAAAVAEEVFARSGSTRTAMVARSAANGPYAWADALAGGAYGAASGIPVLLTDSARLSEATRRALADHDVRETLVLGGTAAVSDAVVRDLPGSRRIAGAERAATAVEIARRLWGRDSAGDGDRFLLTEGYGQHAWALALAASPLAARIDAPVLLTQTTSLPPATAEYFKQLDYGGERRPSGVVLGGEQAVSTAVADAASRLLQ